MRNNLYRLAIGIIVSLVSLTKLWAQPVSLTLTDRDDSGNVFTGFVFYSGNQYGDASIYAKFGGSGTKSFTMFSPGENKNIDPVTENRFFNIRPTGNMVVDKSKVLNFSGSTANIFGSVTITAKQLTITTNGPNVTETTAGSELLFTYVTGTGTYPIDLAIGKFKVQLLTSSGVFIRDMLNSENLYNPPAEDFGYSRGNPREIKATLPADVPPGTYRARVVTNGLTQQVLGTVSSTFVVRSSQLTIKTTSVNITNNYCPGRDQFIVGFTVNGTPPSGTVYTVLISDQNGVFQSPNPSRERDGNILGTGTTSPITCSKTRPIDTYPKGNYKIKVISNNGNVQDDGSSIGVTLIRPDPPSVKNQTYCQDNPISSFEVGASNLMWFGVYTNGNREGWDRREAPPIPKVPGTYSYEVAQIDNNDCQSGYNTFTLVVTGKSAMPSVSNVDQCKGESPRQLSANGQNLIWYSSNGNQLTGPPAPSTDVIGTQVYKVSQQEGSNCRSDQATINVTIKDIPVKPTVPNPDALCQGGPSKALTAIGENLQWYDSNNNAINGAPQPPTNGTTPLTYQVTQTRNGCTSEKATVIQTFNLAPVRPIVSPLLLCLNEASKALSATALSGHRLNWYGQNATGGSASIAAPVITTEASKNLLYYVSQTNEATSCESPRQSLTVVVANKPNAPEVVASQFACLGTPAKALTAKGNDLLWTASSGGGLTSPTTPPTPPTTTAATYSYTVTDRLGSCVSEPSFITFTVRSLPAAPVAQSTQNACIGTPFSLSATGNALKWYSSQSDAENKLNSRSQATIPTNGASSQTWYVTQSDGSGCESPYVPVLARVLSQATARLVGDGEMFSTDSSAVRIHFGGEGPWTLTCWDGEKFRTFNRTLENPLVVWVRLPASLSTQIGVSRPLSFSINSLSNDCGPGVLPTPYQLRINPVTSIDPAIEKVNVLVSPNPISGSILINWLAPLRKAITLRIVSATGRILLQTDRIGTGALQSEIVNTSSLPVGLYIIQLQSSGISLAERRIIKE
ncbi:T9SS C-terminal target domain-containing protein [Fibrisoma montanum]|uniref:T9SS C-terminal target domain-containing protein n=1 Tax=Fibrisoma montanum TaxID=2305895 RepID=A0A418MF64_9BACT|nr:T9SS type A sorting domain-containing protein [Fibrisoma montanum]RIV25416.1 T9SS C-terminal target domain-containing protein [Fibrisoma montanum]